jgi:hypothetical protein
MTTTTTDGLPLPQRYGAIATIIIGISMAVLDGAIANVALPTIASDLKASPASSIWIVNAYQIAITSVVWWCLPSPHCFVPSRITCICSPWRVLRKVLVGRR